MQKDSESLDTGAPSEKLLSEWGAVNYFWARLDVWATGALGHVLNIDVVEVGILVGQLETLAKLQTIQKLLLHKKDKRSKLLAEVIKTLDKLRPLRNAVTHGHYQGISTKGEVVFSIPTQFMVGDSPTANPMFVIYPNDILKHVEKDIECIWKIVAMFGFQKTHELLALPSRLPSYNPPKPPRKRSEKKKAKRQPQPQS
jgi:hypothetical protein